MHAEDRSFTQVVIGASQFIIPVFQRDYSWKEEQCDELLQDILRVGSDSGSRRHFLGSLVYTPTEDNAAALNQWLLIDGQQRMTTLTLLAVALRNHLLETESGDDDSAPSPSQIDAYFLRNEYESGEGRYKLLLRRRDNATLRAYVDDIGLPDSPSERIVENYEFFLERLGELDPALVYKGINRLAVVDVSLDRNDDDPQLIFESLNSTGVDLSQADLIRNYILMKHSGSEQARLYETYWSKIENLFRGSETTFDSFARDYVALKTEASRQEKSDGVYKAFRRIAPELIERFDGIDGLLEDLLQFAGYHTAFSLGRRTNTSLDQPLSYLRRQVDVPAILIMRLYDRMEGAGTLSVKDFESAIELLESYVVRRVICGLQTRGYWQVFANLAYGIGTEEPYNDFLAALATLRDSYKFPENEQFADSLTTKNIYELRVCWHVLDRLENHENKEPTDTSKYTIEHVMPQNVNLAGQWRKMLGTDWKSIQENWLHRLGNLTLTGYNSTYSDRPFEEKKNIDGGFEESSIRLNRYIREQDEWTEKEIEYRSLSLAKSCLKVWPRLVVDQSLIEAKQHRDLQAIAATRDINQLQMSEVARTLHTQLSAELRADNPDLIELPESKSISYHSPAFFLEVIPRKRYLTLLLAPDFNEIDDPDEIAADADKWTFVMFAKHDGGVILKIRNDKDIEIALPLIRQAQQLVTAGD